MQDPVEEEMRRKDEKPPVTVRIARQLALEHFGVRGPHWIDRIVRFGRLATRVVPLNSYDDKNFLFYGRNIVKFYNGVESSHPDFIDAQARAMERARGAGIVTNTPKLTKEGKDVAYIELEGGEGLPARRHAMRMLDFIPGKTLGDVEQSDTLVEEAGSLVGSLDACFRDFDHPGFHRTHLWDLRNSLKLRGFVEHVVGEKRRELAERVLRDFEEKVLQEEGNLRWSVVHNDANDQNILVDGGRVIGIVDWGDALRTWAVCNPAIAIAYLMLDKEKEDMLARAAAFLRGYRAGSGCELEESEIRVIRTLIAVRLACSAIMAAYSSSKEPENEYLTLTLDAGWEALEKFLAIAEQEFLKACDLI